MIEFIVVQDRFWHSGERNAGVCEHATHFDKKRDEIASQSINRKMIVSISCSLAAIKLTLTASRDINGWRFGSRDALFDLLDGYIL